MKISIFFGKSRRNVSISLIFVFVFCRDQITTTEVNMARLHNWTVKQKQQMKK